jgi:hypothetical protein
MSEIANIVIGADYFRKNARSDYASPLPFVWIREAIQNSIDAGATEIKISTDGENIEFADNGCGMNADILTHKLLTLGGTKKELGSVGGFGKAKEVLFFSWDKWFIDTGMDGETRFFVSESMIGNKPIKVYNDKHKDIGTIIGITVENDVFGGVYNWIETFKEYVGFCTTKCKIYIDEEEIETYKLNKKPNVLNESYNLIVDKSISHDEVLIRVNGILMHSRFVGDLGIESTFVIELLGDTQQLLSGNRDGLTYDFRRHLDALIDKVIINPKSLAAEKVVSQIDRYNGIDVEHDVSISCEVLEIVAECTECGITNFKKAEKLIKVKKFDFLEEIEQIIENRSENVGPLGYEFIVKRNGRTKPNLKIDGKRAQTILNYWTNTMVKLCKDNKYISKIGVGLTFGKDTVAELSTVEGKNYFLINPNHVGKTGSNTELGIELFLIAAHEFTHLYVVDHNENFSSKLATISKELAINWGEWQDLFILSKREVLSAFE